MAPAASHPHRSLRFLCPLPYGPLGGAPTFALPGGCEPLPVLRKTPPLPRDIPEVEVMRVGRIPVFQVLGRALRWLRVTFFKMLKHCETVMEALCSTVSPAPVAGKDQAPGTLLETASLSPVGGAGQEWTWAPEASTQEYPEVLAPDVKTVEGYGAVGDQAELDLFEWLEWESCEKEEDDEEPNRASGGPGMGLFLLSPSVMSAVGRQTGASQLLTSEGEQEEEEGSDWSEDDWDDDGDCEGSEVDSKLWESFIRNDDPFNPFGFSSLTGKKGESPGMEDWRMAGPRHIAEGGTERVNETEGGGSHHSPQAGKKMGKKVRFSEEVKVRPLVAWAFASRAARDGSCWQEMARDRDRFRRRVLAASDVISPFLQANHRAGVWAGRQLQ